VFFTVVHRGTDFRLTAASCLYRCSDTFISARIRRDWPPAFYGKPNTSFLGCYTKREKAGASITLKPMKRWPSQPPRRKKRLGHNVRESIKVMTPPLGRIGSELVLLSQKYGFVCQFSKKKFSADFCPATAKRRGLTTYGVCQGEEGDTQSSKLSRISATSPIPPFTSLTSSFPSSPVAE